MDRVTASRRALVDDDIVLAEARSALLSSVDEAIDGTHLDISADPVSDAHPHAEIVAQPPEESVPRFDLRTLLVPHPSIESEEERRRATLLSSFLLAALPIIPVVLVVRLLVMDLPPMVQVAQVVAGCAILALWVVARTRYYRIAAAGLPLLCIGLFAVVAWTGLGPKEALGTACIAAASLFVAGVTLRPREMLLITGGALVVLVSTVLLSPDLPPETMVPPIILMTFGAATVLASRQLREEDHDAMEVQAAALLRSQERYEMAARGATDGLWDWDLRTGQVFLSPRWCGLLGLTTADVPPPCTAGSTGCTATICPGCVARWRPSWRAPTRCSRAPTGCGTRPVRGGGSGCADWPCATTMVGCCGSPGPRATSPSGARSKTSSPTTPSTIP